MVNALIALIIKAFNLYVTGTKYLISKEFIIKIIINSIQNSKRYRLITDTNSTKIF